MGNRTEDGSSVLATSKHRQRIREDVESQREESVPIVGPDNPLLTLEWSERSWTMNLLANISNCILRYYDGGELEVSMWLCLSDRSVRDGHDRIRVVVRQLLETAGWKVRFANGGPDERIFLSK